MRQVGDGGGDDVAAPAVLDRHRDAQRHAQVARLPRPRQAAELADLDVDHVHRLVGVAAQQHVDPVDRLVQHERVVRPPPDRQALFVRRARLLDVDVHVAHAAHHARGLVHEPAGVGVGDQHVARLERCTHRADPLDIGLRIAAHLQLEAPVALRPVACHLRRHLGR